MKNTVIKRSGRKIYAADVQKWIDALRSGEYSQGFHELQSDSSSFCCLGVACKLFIPDSKLDLRVGGMIRGSTPGAQKRAPVWLQLVNTDFYERTGTELIALNDHLKFSFDEIADLLQAVYVEEVL